MRIFLNRLGTSRSRTTAYHPRTNGLVKRLNGLLGDCITKYLAGTPVKHWTVYLQQALFAARIRTHQTIRYWPFYLLYGVEPKLATDDKGVAPLQSDTRGYEVPLLEYARFDAQNKTTIRGQRNARYWNKNVQKPGLKIGDWVLVQNNFQKKMEKKWYGPYLIDEIRPLNTYKLLDPSGNYLERLVTGDRMKLAVVQGKPTIFTIPRKRGRSKKNAMNEEFVAMPEDSDEEPDF